MRPVADLRIPHRNAYGKVFWVVACLALHAGVTPADQIEFTTSTGRVESREGNIVHEIPEGELVFEARDGQQWVLDPSQIQSLKRSDEPLEPFGRKELEESLAAEYGSAFRVRSTKNYVIVYSTGEEFAEEAGKLFERIKSVFETYMRQQAKFTPTGFKQPMIAVVFGSQDEYVRAMTSELGPIARATAGVYSPQSNRMFMFDMFGGRDEKWLRGAAVASQRSPQEIALLLTNENISTVIHEGIHQVAFNSGFHRRNIANPVWFVEGVATIMEVPELDSRGRWTGIGQINWDRADYLKQHWHEVGPDSLEQLIASDLPLRDTRTAHLAYAQSWGLTYYLSKARKKEFLAYVERINGRPILVDYSAEERQADFREVFGQTPEQLSADMARYLEKVVFRKSRRSR